MQRTAFTLVELLVVIAIIGMLVGLLLPAVQQAREAARRMQCNNNLKQMGLASLNLESTARHYPSGGWNWKFTGDPDAGFDEKQMGGWTYSLLPFMEQNNAYQLGADGDPGTESTTQKNGAKARAESPVALFFCPSRRQCKPYSSNTPVNSAATTGTGRTDYGCNSGNNQQGYSEVTSYSMSKTYNFATPTSKGVIFGRSRVTVGEVRDGTSNTYLIGEKYMSPEYYETSYTSDNEPIYTGSDWDSYRIATTSYRPCQDRLNCYTTGTSHFGSIHAGAFGMVMCDGSVQSISYSIDGETHQNLGLRNDGKVVTVPN